MTVEELNEYYTFIRPDLFIQFWSTRGRPSMNSNWSLPTYYVIIKKNDEIKLRAISERLEELDRIVKFSLGDIYEIN